MKNLLIKGLYIQGKTKDANDGFIMTNSSVLCPICGETLEFAYKDNSYPYEISKTDRDILFKCKHGACYYDLDIELAETYETFLFVRNVDAQFLDYEDDNVSPKHLTECYVKIPVSRINKVSQKLDISTGKFEDEIVYVSSETYSWDEADKMLNKKNVIVNLPGDKELELSCLFYTRVSSKKIYICTQNGIPVVESKYLDKWCRHVGWKKVLK